MKVIRSGDGARRGTEPIKFPESEVCMGYVLIRFVFVFVYVYAEPNRLLLGAEI
jgi:hypothetical protein